MGRWILIRLRGIVFGVWDLMGRLQDEMEDLVAMSNELGESLGRSYEVPDCTCDARTRLMGS